MPGNKQQKNDQYFMRQAIKEAMKAELLDEVPIGAVIVHDDKIIARGHNLREKKQSSLAHAEILAIEKACKKIGSWRLEDCVLYVTLEPCPMCAGAIINARIRRLVFGARDPKSGCFGSVSDFNALAFNHKPQVVCGVRGEECAQILSAFFQKLRRGRQ